MTRPEINIDVNGDSNVVAGGNVYMGPRGLWDLPDAELHRRREFHVKRYKRNRLLFWLNGYLAAQLVFGPFLLWVSWSQRDLIATTSTPIWAPLVVFGVALGTPAWLLARYRKKLAGEDYNHTMAVQAIDEVLHRRA